MNLLNRRIWTQDFTRSLQRLRSPKGKCHSVPELTLTLHKIGRILPSSPVILRVDTKFSREKWADVE